MFEIVNGAIGIRRSRPGQPRARCLGCLFRENGVVGHRSRHGPHHVERVERRDSRPRLADVHAGIGDIETLSRRPYRNPQQEAFRAAPRLLFDERRAQPSPFVVEKQRVFARTLRHQALGKAWHEDDAEGTPAGLVRCPDEQVPVAS